MERYNQIIAQERFRTLLNRMEQLEQNREYCRHDLTHLLDVCRVAYIFALEENMCDSVGGKDVIYAAGLLHDLGRVAQYEQGIPHEEESVRLAKMILPECGYTQDEIKMITNAISNHRKDADNDNQLLSRYLQKADNKVRNCFACQAAGTCKWDEKRKNRGIV